MSKQKKIIMAVLVFIIALYFILPPHNKIAQLGYLINNLKFNMSTQETDAYVFHRNNAVYLARMDNAEDAIKEMDKAVDALPMNISSNILYGLYRDRANIKMYYGDYRGALNDFLRIPSHGMNDYLVIAMLLKENGKKKLAVSYCNKILDIDLNAYAGYACIADIYASAGKYQASIALYDLLIDRSQNKARYYADRAIYKEKSGDIAGAKEDYKKAKDLSPVINFEESLTYNAIHPKKLTLSIR